MRNVKFWIGKTCEVCGEQITDDEVEIWSAGWNRDLTECDVDHFRHLRCEPKPPIVEPTRIEIHET